VVQALNLIAIYNPGTTATMIDGAFFQDEVEERKIMAVPMVFQDNNHIGQGRMTLEEIVAKLIPIPQPKKLKNSMPKMLLMF
jgi:alkyl hydroperoxide reductase subunit F